MEINAGDVGRFEWTQTYDKDGTLLEVSPARFYRTDVFEDGAGI